MKKFLSVLKCIFIYVCIIFAASEAACYIYIRWFNTNIPLPTYTFINANSRFWVPVNKHFGVWHEPHSAYLHNKACFNVTYTANSFGMRDKERSLHSAKPRAVLLGDSFIEGWGNTLSERLSGQLEKRLGCEVLNFGTAGGFGTIQEWLQYKHLVKQFEHDVVLLGILPHDDFKDNNLEYNEKINPDSYKPFLKGNYPDFKLYYKVNKIPSPKNQNQIMRSIDFTLREWSSLYRVLRYLGSYRLKDMKLVPRWQAASKANLWTISQYYSFNQKDWMVMRYTIEQLVLESRGKKLIVFTIPVPSDFMHYTGTEPPLARNLRELATKLNFVYIDLLQELAARGIPHEKLFFVCDAHWNAYGNAKAAEILSPYIKEGLAQSSRAYAALSILPDADQIDFNYGTGHLLKQCVRNK